MPKNVRFITISKVGVNPGKYPGSILLTPENPDPDFGVGVGDNLNPTLNPMISNFQDPYLKISR